MRADLAPVSSLRSTEPADSQVRCDVLDSLRAEIGSIERRSPAAGRVAPAAQPEDAWTFDEAGLDALVGPRGLEIGAVHEVKPAALLQDGGTQAGWAALCASGRRFALALAVRRLSTLRGARRDAPVLVCSSASQSAELGAFYGPGLSSLGLDPGRLIVAEPARGADVLWAVEQGLASQGLAMVIGEVAEVDLSPARRLGLAASRSLTPCVLVTHPRGEPAAATSTRWRVSPALGPPDDLDREAPGAACLRVSLERCRTAPARGSWCAPLLLEWCDAAYRFRVAAGVADRSSRAGSSAGWACAPMETGKRA